MDNLGLPFRRSPPPPSPSFSFSSPKHTNSEPRTPRTDAEPIDRLNEERLTEIHHLALEFISVAIPFPICTRPPPSPRTPARIGPDAAMSAGWDGHMCRWTGCVKASMPDVTSTHLRAFWFILLCVICTRAHGHGKTCTQIRALAERMWHTEIIQIIRAVRRESQANKYRNNLTAPNVGAVFDESKEPFARIADSKS